MHVGLFGGSFNPPHLGHLLIAEHAREAFGLEQVWWIPAYHPPHKSASALAAASHRLEMTKRATAGNPYFAVSDVEIRRKGISYTLDTIRALQATHTDATFRLLLGSDTLSTFATWHQPEAVIEQAPLLIYRRPSFDPDAVDPRFLRRARFAEAPPVAISSTDIRRRCRAKRSIRYLVPEAVRAYIDQQGLYID